MGTPFDSDEIIENTKRIFLTGGIGRLKQSPSELKKSLGGKRIFFAKMVEETQVILTLRR